MKKYGVQPERGITTRKFVKRYGIKKGLTIAWFFELSIWILLISALWIFPVVVPTLMAMIILVVINNVAYYFLGAKSSFMMAISVIVLLSILALELPVSRWLFMSETPIPWGIFLGCLGYLVVLSGVIPTILRKTELLK